MLLIVQLVQIARAQTTFENMRGHSMDQGEVSAEALTSALTAGTTSLSGAGLTGAGMGPNPAATRPPHAPSKKKTGFFAQWKKLLGLDTFVATAQDAATGTKRNRRRKKNPFSRGIVTNCKDFWCDPAPYFGSRRTGEGMLGGEVVNYTRMYDAPLRVGGGSSRRRGGDRMEYQRLAGDEGQEDV